MDVQHATNVQVKGSNPFEGFSPLFLNGVRHCLLNSYLKVRFLPAVDTLIG